MHTSPIWSPSSVGGKKILEKIMRRLTKKLPGLSSQTYSQRLGFLHSMSLENRRLFVDLVYVYKFTHGLLDCAAKDVGLDIAKTITRGSGVRLYQLRLLNAKSAVMFKFRAAREWNALPMAIVSCKAMTTFKKKLNDYLMLMN